MCDVVEGSVTFTGPYGALRELEYAWEGLRTVHDMELRPPIIQTFGRLKTRRPFDDPAAPATAAAPPLRSWRSCGRASPGRAGPAPTADPGRTRAPHLAIQR